MSQKYTVSQVFTPTTPARVAFVDRESINNKLVNALQLPGKQIVVYGHSGSGKTTLLVNKLNQLYERHITTRCMKGLKFDQLILDAFDQLSPFYVAEKDSKSTTNHSVELAASYNLISSKIYGASSNEISKKELRILPPQLTPQTLGKFLGQAKCCWILEDFHKIDESEKTKLSQLMKVFMDMADDYPELKIISLGAINTARQVIDYDREMTNRVGEIHVELMTNDEIKSIIKKGEEALNISFSSDVVELVANSSNGLGSVCHHLCLNMCNAIGINETCKETVTLSKTHYEEALKMFAEEASDSIRRAFDLAIKQRRKTKYDNANLVLKSMTKFKERGASRAELLKKIRESEKNYPESNLKLILPKLLTEEYGVLIKYDQISGLYSFSDPVYRVFAIANYQDDRSSDSMSIDKDDNLFQLFKLFSNASATGFRVRIENIQ